MKKLPLFLLLLISAKLTAQQDDGYTRYELLDPTSQSFRILYDVTATEAGAEYYFNTLRKGSEHKVDGVVDRMTGQPLTWTIVNGVDAKKSGLASASPDVDYLKVKLARAVTAGSEYRLTIDKTYKDPKSYFTENDRIVFDRSLGVKRNSVVLPRGYELVKCNYPAQVIMEPDGRIKISFLNNGPGEVPLRVEGRKLPASANLTITPPPTPTPPAVG